MLLHKQNSLQTMQNILTSCWGMLLCTFSMVVHAEVSVDSNTWPKQLPVSEYGAHNYYGNGKTYSFERALEHPGEMSESEHAAIAAMLPESEYNRWYVKVAKYNATTKVSGIKNKSADTLEGLAILTKKVSKDKKAFTLGAGYTWSTWRIDVEYLKSQKLRYNADPLFTTTTNALASEVIINNLLANVYYDFREFYIFKPFVALSVGGARNTAKTKFNGNAEKSHSSLAAAYGLQLGARIRVLHTNALLGASYRYRNLGKVKWGDEGSLKLQGKVAASSFNLEFMYLL